MCWERVRSVGQPSVQSPGHGRNLGRLHSLSAKLGPRTALATNSSASFRWLPSELNSSDEPSRLYDSAPSKLLADQIPHPSHATGQTEAKVRQPVKQSQSERDSWSPEDTSNQQEKPDFDFGNECTEKQQAVNQQGFRPQSSSPRAALATEPKEANRDADRQQLKHQPVSVTKARPSGTGPSPQATGQAFIQDGDKLLPGQQQSPSGHAPGTASSEQFHSGELSSYQAELERFMKYAQRHQLDTNLGEAMDNSLVQHMNALYRQGF